MLVDHVICLLINQSVKNKIMVFNLFKIYFIISIRNDFFIHKNKINVDCM